MNTLLKIPKEILRNGIKEIKKAGAENREGFVLFLGNLKVKPWIISEVYIPHYESGSQFYKITSLGDQQLTNHLIKTRLMVVAQLHSHPRKAFHSAADDEMATVGHIDGFSFVLPNFGSDASAENFANVVKTYQLKKGGSWEESLNETWEVV